MSVVEIWEILKDDPGINAFVPDSKVFPGVAFEGTQAPYISIYSLLSSGRRLMGNRTLRIQVSCFDTIYGRVQALADAVESAIENLDGQNGVFAAYIDGRVDIYETDTKLNHVAITGEIHFQSRPIFG